MRGDGGMTAGADDSAVLVRDTGMAMAGFSTLHIVVFRLRTRSQSSCVSDRSFIRMSAMVYSAVYEYARI